MNGIQHHSNGQNGNTNIESDNSEGNTLLRDVFEMIMRDVLEKGKNRKCNVINFEYPKVLGKKLDLDIRPTSSSMEDLMDLCKDVVKYSVISSHPFSNNQLFQGVDVVGLAAKYLGDALKTSMYTYEMAPVFVLMENYLIGKILNLCGFENGDGTFCPGGSMCNMYAINLARFQHNPDVKQKGNRDFPQGVIFTSDVSHYSFSKGASFMGIGSENVFKVKSDDRGKMIPEELERGIISTKEKGDTPLLVVATSGSTVQGSYDELDKLSDVCRKYGVWLHVDAAWGGAALLSRTERHKMAGIDRADSMTWCLHKMMGAPLQCSVLVLNNKGNILSRCHSAAASYLFQPDKFYGAEYDTGDKSIQCSRLADAFKAWFLWKAKGDIMLEQETDNKFDMARECANLIRNRDGFRLIWEPECCNVCFWYIPRCLRDVPVGPEFWERLNKFAPLLKKEMMTKGTMMVAYQPLKDKVNFWRMIFSNTEFNRQHLVDMIDEFERLAMDIEV